MKKIVKNDEVIVLTGKYKNKKGTVLRVCPDGKRVIVEGINIVKKSMRPNPQKNQPGGIVEKEAPLNISNVALFDPVSNKPSKVGFKQLKDGKKVRYYKKSGEVIGI